VPNPRVDTAFEGLAWLLERTEDRRMAPWGLILGLALSVVTWYVGLRHWSWVMGSAVPAHTTTWLESRMAGLRMWLFMAALFIGPFVAAVAVMQIVSAPDSDEDLSDIMPGYAMSQRAARQRRLLLTGAVATVANALALYVLTH